MPERQFFLLFQAFIELAVLALGARGHLALDTGGLAGGRMFDLVRRLHCTNVCTLQYCIEQLL